MGGWVKGRGGGAVVVDMKVSFFCDDQNQDQSLILIQKIAKERTPSNDWFKGI